MGCDETGKHVFSISYGNNRFHMIYKDCYKMKTGSYNLTPEKLLSDVNRIIEKTEDGSFDVVFTKRARRKLGEITEKIESNVEIGNSGILVIKFPEDVQDNYGF